MSIKKELGAKIKRLRQKRGITQEKLAEMANISVRTLGGIEIGANFMTAQTLEKIVECLGVKTSELFESEHLKPTEDLIKEIHSTLHNYRNNREKIEEIYKVINAIVSV